VRVFQRWLYAVCGTLKSKNQLTAVRVRSLLVRFPRGIIRCPTRNVARSMTIQWSSVHTSRHTVRSHCGHRGNWSENVNNRRKKKGDERVITEGETTNKKIARSVAGMTLKKKNEKRKKRFLGYNAPSTTQRHLMTNSTFQMILHQLKTQVIKSQARGWITVLTTTLLTATASKSKTVTTAGTSQYILTFHLTTINYSGNISILSLHFI